MTETSTVTISMQTNTSTECSYAIVTKEKNQKVSKCLIVLREMEVAIFDYATFACTNTFNFEYLLLKHYPTTKDAYTDFLKLIGKMCKKSIESKYFLNHKKEDNRIVFYDNNNEVMITEAIHNIANYQDRLNTLKSYLIKCHENEYFKQ